MGALGYGSRHRRNSRHGKVVIAAYGKNEKTSALHSHVTIRPIFESHRDNG